jgi:hypothetical protein
LGRAYLAQIDLLWRGLVAHGGLATRR